MKATIGLRSRRMALAAVATFVVAGGIAFAAIPDAGTGVYHACMKHNGTIRIIDPELQHCKASSEVEITFNREGPKGDPGPQGPSGQDGEDGEDGQDGTPFSGTFTSPNGEYSLSVTDAGIVLSGAASTISLTSSGVAVQTATNLTLESGLGLFAQAGTGVSIVGGGSASAINLTSSGVGVESDGDLTLQSDSGLFAQAGSTVSIEGSGSATLRGSTVRVNPGAVCNPAARVGDEIAGAGGGSAPVTGNIITGSARVCVG